MWWLMWLMVADGRWFSYNMSIVEKRKGKKKVFTLQNYNEFKNHVRWHDYFAIMVNEFPVVLVRRYDWMDTERYTLTVQVLGMKLFQRVGDM